MKTDKALKWPAGIKIAANTYYIVNYVKNMQFNENILDSLEKIKSKEVTVSIIPLNDTLML